MLGIAEKQVPGTCQATCAQQVPGTYPQSEVAFGARLARSTSSPFIQTALMSRELRMLSSGFWLEHDEVRHLSGLQRAVRFILAEKPGAVRA